jgi:hypothetical protein
MTNRTATFDGLHTSVQGLVTNCISDAINYLNDMMAEPDSGPISTADVYVQSIIFMQIALDPVHCNVEISQVVKDAVAEIVATRLCFSLSR